MWLEVKEVGIGLDAPESQGNVDLEGGASAGALVLDFAYLDGCLEDLSAAHIFE